MINNFLSQQSESDACQHEFSLTWSDDRAIEVCSKCLTKREIDDEDKLRQILRSEEEICREYKGLAHQVTGAKAKEWKKAVKSKEKQIAAVKQKLRELESGTNATALCARHVTVEPVDLSFTSPLKEEEKKELLRLERKVERGFYEAGDALRTIRDKKLYRESYSSFEEYCQVRFGFNRSRSYQLIDAATVVDNLEKCPQIVDIFPSTESQCRPLVRLESQLQVSAWQQAVEENNGKVPPARIVKDVVRRIMEKIPAPNPFHLGEVCSILVKENPDLKGLGGCWAVVVDVCEFSCLVHTWRGEISVRIENLELRDYSPQGREEMIQLSTRISQLREVDALDEDFVRGNLEMLGKIKRPFLTEKEEAVLQLFERMFGVGSSK